MKPSASKSILGSLNGIPHLGLFMSMVGYK